MRRKIIVSWAKIGFVFLVSLLAFPGWAQMSSASAEKAFYRLALKGDSRGIRDLQYQGYALDSENEDGETALCHAMREKEAHAVTLLIKLGADRNHPCAKSYIADPNRPMTYAEKRGIQKTTEGLGRTTSVVLNTAGIALLAGGVAVAVSAADGGGGGKKYDVLECGANAYAQAGICVCLTGYEGDPTVGCTLIQLDCGANAHQVGINCVCNTGHNHATNCETCLPGYAMSNGVCYPELTCLNGGTQVGAVCQCSEGWFGPTCALPCPTDQYWDGQSCQPLPDNAAQPGEDASEVDRLHGFVCTEGYVRVNDQCIRDLDGVDADDPDLVHGTNLIIINNIDQQQNFINIREDQDFNLQYNVPAIQVKAFVGTDGREENVVVVNAAAINMQSYAQYGISANGQNTFVLNTEEGSIVNNTTSGTGAAAALGILAQNGAQVDNSGLIELQTVGTAVSYGVNASGAGTLVGNYGTINLTKIAVGSQPGGQDFYGLFATNNAEIRNLGTVTLTNEGAATVYGAQASGGTIYNAGTMTITNTGSGVTYGMQANNTLNNYGVVSVTTSGGGDTYGLSSSGSGVIQNTGSLLVNVEQSAAQDSEEDEENPIPVNENVYGMQATSSAATVQNSGDITVSSEETSELVVGIMTNAQTIQNSGGTISVSQLAATAAADVYGIQSQAASSIAYTLTNASDIEVSHAGSGAAYGIYSNGTVSVAAGFRNLTNSGDVAVERTGAGTDDVVGIYALNVINSTSSVNNQGNGNTLNNSGAISVSNKSGGQTFGIQTQMLNNINSGAITVSKTGSTANAGNTSGIEAMEHCSSHHLTLSNTGAISVSQSGGTTADVLSGIHTNAFLLDNGAQDTSGGTIVVNASRQLTGVYGIFQERGTNASVSLNNYGSITATGTATAQGLIAGIWSAGSVVNNGTIAANAVNSSLGDTYGIYASGSLNNTGDVSVSNTGVSTYTTTSENVALFATGTVQNSGDLSVEVDFSGTAIGIQTNAQINNQGNITIEQTNGKNTTQSAGIYGGSGTITNSGTITFLPGDSEGNVYGIYAGSGSIINDGVVSIDRETGVIAPSGGRVIAGLYTAGGAVTSNADVTLSYRGNANEDPQYTTYGIYANGGQITTAAGTTIKNNSYGISPAYGVYQDGNATTTNQADIIMNDAQDWAENGWSNYNGSVVALYNDATGSLTNSGDITVMNTGGNSAYGIYNNGSGSVQNSGTINMTNLNTEVSGSVYGIYAKGGSITNTGAINISNAVGGQAYGIYLESGASLNNSGDITITCLDGTCASGSAYGIYGVAGASITNTGKITVYGSAQNALSGQADLDNAGELTVVGTLNFDELGTTTLSDGGVFRAETISGLLYVSGNTVSKGFETTYVQESALEAEDMSGLTLLSTTPLFTASTVQNAAGATDVVMTFNGFDQVMADQEMAEFLNQNYALGANAAFFEQVKTLSSASDIEKATAALTGSDILPVLQQENFGVMRSINRAINEELFTTRGDTRSIVAYDLLYQHRQTKGVITGYDDFANSIYGLFDKKVGKNTRAGWGLSVTHLYSDYDNDATRNDLMVQVFFPSTFQIDDTTTLVATPRIGYADSKYKRYAGGHHYTGRPDSWIFGVGNEIRRQYQAGFVTLEPTIELNLLGYMQDKIHEGGIGGITLKRQMYTSFEGGIGLYARKDMTLAEGHKLGIRAGGSYYREFLNPAHDMRASVQGMQGLYSIRGIPTERSRGLVSVSAEYEWQNLTLSTEFVSFIESDTRSQLRAGIRFNF